MNILNLKCSFSFYILTKINLLNSISNILLKRQIGKENTAIKKQFLKWDAIEKIAIIIDNTLPVNKSLVDAFCLDTKRYVEVYYIELNLKQPTFADWKCFTKKHTTIFNLPKQLYLNELKSKAFNCVINTCHHQNLFAISLQSTLQAPIKCSDNTNYNQTDLIILKSPSSTIISYLNDVIHYLKMIK